MVPHPYVRSYLARHARNGGIIDELVTDPGFLLAADRPRLLGTIRSVATELGMRSAQVYAIASNLLERSSSREEAASYLELVCRQTGAHELANKVSQLPIRRPWSVPWAQWQRVTTHKVLSTHGPTGAVALEDIDGELVVVAAEASNVDKTVRVEVWDTATGQPAEGPFQVVVSPRLRRNYHSLDSVVTAFALGEIKGQRVVVLGMDNGTVEVWNLGTGDREGKPSRGHKGRVAAVAIGSVEGRPVVVSGGHDHTVRAWDLVTGQE